jgi:hypothetical protein
METLVFIACSEFVSFIYFLCSVVNIILGFGLWLSHRFYGLKERKKERKKERN